MAAVSRRCREEVFDLMSVFPSRWPPGRVVRRGSRAFCGHGLDDESDAERGDAAAFVFVHVIGRHQDQAQAGVSLAGDGHQIEACHAGHADVRNEAVVGLLFEARERFDRRAVGIGLVPVQGEA